MYKKKCIKKCTNKIIYEKKERNKINDDMYKLTYEKKRLINYVDIHFMIKKNI